MIKFFWSSTIKYAQLHANITRAGSLNKVLFHYIIHSDHAAC